MGHMFQSPLRRWDVLAGLAETISAKTFVEVGCKEGRTTGFMLQSHPDLQVIAIDPWAPVGNADESYQDWNYGQIERDFWANVEGHSGRLNMHRCLSLEAATKLNHSSFDMVFIDAGHDYDNALADIIAWWPLVREGGILCGHDYQHKFPGVMRAVARCFPLWRVMVMPDSIWAVEKTSAVRMAA